MRFIADVMLGKLAKWLRILGYDVLYSNRFEDDEITRLAVLENRLILTRDTRLVERRLARDHFLLVESDHYEDQLRQVVQTFQLDLEQGLFTRCLECNRELQAVPKGEVQGEVPPYTYRTHERFSRCPHCRRVFWQGTHWDRMVDKLRRIVSQKGSGARAGDESRPEAQASG